MFQLDFQKSFEFAASGSLTDEQAFPHHQQIMT